MGLPALPGFGKRKDFLEDFCLFAQPKDLFLEARSRTNVSESHPSLEL